MYDRSDDEARRSALVLTDFSTGIVSNGNFATSAPPVPTPTAREAKTYRCIALPNGGLGPLPRRIYNDSIPFPSGGSATRAYVVGMHARLVSNDVYGVYEGVYIVLDANATPVRRDYLYLYSQFHFTFEKINFSDQNYPNTPTTSTDHFVHDGIGLQLTPAGVVMDSAVISERAVVAFSTIAAGVRGGNGPLVFFHGGYPPSHVATFWATLGASASRVILMLWHQGRIVTGEYFVNEELTATVDNYQFLGGLTYSYPYFQDLDFQETGDTSGFLRLDRFQTFGAWGSISVGELVLIGQSGGDSLLIQGDLDNPTVTILRGVRGTGKIAAKGVPTSVGLLYAVEKDGIWAWNGDNSSTKISPQLRDNFYELPTPRLGITYQAAAWGDYVLYPNNFVFHIPSSSWWKMDDDADAKNITWTSTGGRYAWGAVDYVESGNTGTLHQYDRAAPAYTYSYHSHPMRVSSYGKQVNVTDVEIVAVPGAASTNQTITLELYGDNDTIVQTETFTFNGPTTIPIRKRLPTYLSAYDISFRVVADGNSNPAPTIHSITFLYDDNTAPVAS